MLVIARTGNRSFFGDGFPDLFSFDWLSNKHPCCLLRQSKKSVNTIITRKSLILKDIFAFVSGFLYDLSGFQSPFVRIFIRSVCFFIKTNGRLSVGQFIYIGTERSPSESSQISGTEPN